MIKKKDINENDVLNFKEILEEKNKIDSLIKDKERLENKLQEIDSSLKGDGREFIGIANEVNILKLKEKEMNAMYMCINTKVINQDNEIKNMSKDINNLKDSDKKHESKIEELYDFMSKEKNTRSSIKMLWTIFVAIISAIATIITIILNLFKDKV